MGTYVLHDGRLYRAEASRAALSTENLSPGHLTGSECCPEVWRIEGDGAVREHRFILREVRGPLTLDLCGACEACEAELVYYRLTLRPGEPVDVERTSPRPAKA